MLCNTNKKLWKRANPLRPVSPARCGCVSVLTWQLFLLPWGDGRQSPTSVAMVAVWLLNAGFARHGGVATPPPLNTSEGSQRRGHKLIYMLTRCGGGGLVSGEKRRTARFVSVAVNEQVNGDVSIGKLRRGGE